MNLLNLLPSDATNNHSNRRLDNAKFVGDCLLAYIPSCVFFAYRSYLLLREFGCSDLFSPSPSSAIPLIFVILLARSFSNMPWIKTGSYVTGMSSFWGGPAAIGEIESQSRGFNILLVKPDNSITFGFSKGPKQTFIRVVVVDGRDEPIEFAAGARIDSTHRCSPVTAVLGRDRSQQSLGSFYYIKRAAELMFEAWMLQIFPGRIIGGGVVRHNGKYFGTNRA